MSRYDLPYDEFVKSMKAQLSTARYVEGYDFHEDYLFFSFSAQVDWANGRPGADDRLDGLIRQHDDGRVDWFDPERSGWVTAPIDTNTLEPIGLDEAERMATYYRAGLSDEPIAKDRSAPSKEPKWAYYAMLDDDDQPFGLLRRAGPYEIDRLDTDGTWDSIPALERLFSMGAGGIQVDVTPLSPDEARERAIKLGGKL